MQCVHNNKTILMTNLILHSPTSTMERISPPAQVAYPGLCNSRVEARAMAKQYFELLNLWFKS